MRHLFCEMHMTMQKGQVIHAADGLTSFSKKKKKSITDSHCVQCVGIKQHYRTEVTACFFTPVYLQALQQLNFSFRRLIPML